MIMRKKLLLLLPVLLLTACFGGGETIPQDQFYRLSESKYPDKTLPPIAAVLAVSTPDSDVLHRERAMLYSHADEPLKLERYHYHHWTHIPARMIQDHLIDYLRTTGLATQVVRYGEQARIDAQIGGQLRRFERVLGSGHASVVVQLELFYRGRSGNKLSVQNVYTQQINVTDDSMHTTAAAFSQALEKIYSDFVRDIAAQSGL